LPQPERSEIGTLFFGVWIVGYAPLIERTLNVMPILAASAMITGTIALSTARVSATRRTFLHAAASHLPSPFVSYFEPFIAFLARVSLPESFGVRYGSYSDRMLWSIGFGTMCVAMSPAVGPPQPFRSACLSMT
jgi:hypothetical protein